MKLPRRQFLHLAAGAALPIVPRFARAQAYPSRPVHLIVGFPASGLTDMTMGEFVVGYEASVWNGVVAPKGTPPAIVDKLHEASEAALADPTLMTQFDRVGSVPKSMTPADFGKFIAEDTEKWGRVIRGSNIKPE
jgi:tripartite-type tricarboxylate transporter receptor subunit TctC